MDADQLKAIETEIAAGVDTAANIAEVVAPQYAGFIVLGQAVAKAFPPLMEDVNNLINATEPNAAANAALAAKIGALTNPETL